ncbi:MAG: DUF2341 domain-containing protein [Ignavibacteria bacterium]
MKNIFRFLQTFFIILTFFFFTKAVNSQLANWAGEMPVTVHNNSSSTMTNVQVPIIFSSAQIIARGLMQTNGNDIRFGSDCGSSTAYNYWLEGYMNTDTTKVWVLVPSVNANDSLKFYMFFGNSGASAGSTLTIFNGPWSAIDSVVTASTGGSAGTQRGFRFTANQDLLVPSFGKKEPTGSTRYITIFNYNTQAIVYQSQVSGPAAQFDYTPLATPLWLSSGLQYVVEIFQGSGDGYYFGLSTSIGAALTYGDMRYCNSCTQNTFPTSVLAGYQYGYPDFLYYLKNTVSPAPTTTFGLPADTVTPASPSGLIGIAGNQTATLRWNKNTEFDLDKYLVYRGTTNNPASSTLIDSVAGSPPDSNYTATGLTNGTTYYFWVKAADRFCNRRTSGYSNMATVTPVVVASIQKGVPKQFALHQNYPNPFNPVTRILYDLPKGSIVKITVFDITGREVETLVNEFLAAGYHEADFDATNLASGVYFYKLEAGSFVDQKKMIVLK